jgi:hypothetical protein
VNLYVWERLQGLTDSWHDGGGVVAVAADLGRARELVRERAQGDCEGIGEPPDYTYEVSDDDGERVIIFRDAGCC